ncbi:unnamed protein product [Paramecium primaurelia]|uniref:Uncharacterized protein n=1 Tax=Paramecium primaurelia TaxID=5886 RepID=A0A8S1MXN1_PARPR|nr:unnamed protein product [Paramecium primaurelia]
MIFKFVFKVGIQSIKYQIRPCVASYRALSNNYLHLHNLNTFQLNQLTRFAEEEENDFNELNLINCLSEVKSIKGNLSI